MFERIAPEQYDTLPDIPEPCENPVLVGHAEAVQSLAKSVAAGKLHHAILLSGPPGIGKATFAFHLARHLLTDGDGDPEKLVASDASSQAFRLIAQGAHPSVLHLTRPYIERDKRFRTVITVEEIRRVNRFLSMTSHDGGYRVVIVDPADDMNNNAANALLKSLEEPPVRTVFILVAHSVGRLLPTIRSRCHVVRLHPLDETALLGLLEKLTSDLPADPAARRALAARAAGSVRNAVLLTQYGGLEIADVAEKVVTAPRFDVAEAHRLGDAVTGRDKSVQFSIFNTTVLEFVATRATRAAEAGDIVLSNRFAGLWNDINAANRDAEIYNLDRRQHVIGALTRLHGFLHAAAHK